MPYDRDEINQFDVVRAYKTFLKLLKTDLTKYKAIPERVKGINGYSSSSDSESYLICDKSNSYYKLEPGESPDDFIDTCDCGVKLEYRKDL